MLPLLLVLALLPHVPVSIQSKLVGALVTMTMLSQWSLAWLLEVPREQSSDRARIPLFCFLLRTSDRLRCPVGKGACLTYSG